MASYDPTENPRWLGDEEDPFEPDPQLLELADQLGDVNAAIEWVSTDQWRAFDGYIAEQIENAIVDALQATDITRLAECRGHIRALEKVREFPANLRHQQARSLGAVSGLQENNLEGS